VSVWVNYGRTGPVSTRRVNAHLVGVSAVFDGIPRPRQHGGRVERRRQHAHGVALPAQEGHEEE